MLNTVITSVAVFAEISLSSPRKLFIFTIKKIYLSDQSIKKNMNFEKNFTGYNFRYHLLLEASCHHNTKYSVLYHTSDILHPGSHK